MTHEELLDKIDYFTQIDKSLDGTMGIANWTQPAKALRAVVELHRPALDNEIDNESDNDRLGCGGCDFNFDYMMWSVAYPCRTIQAIEKVLDDNGS